MAKERVKYAYGKKDSYINKVTVKDDMTLYFCTDTHELFKGENLYSDGLRLADTYKDLPEFKLAADGTLYFCKDNGCGYVLNETRDGWIPVIHGVDNETIEVNDNGLLAVKSVEIERVNGLKDTLDNIEKHILDIDKELPVFDDEKFDITATGVITLKQLESSGITHKGTDLDVLLDEIQESITWQCFDEVDEFDVNLTDDTSDIVQILEGAKEGTIVTLSEGSIDKKVTFANDITVNGLNEGIIQNFKQEV